MRCCVRLVPGAGRTNEVREDKGSEAFARVGGRWRTGGLGGGDTGAGRRPAVRGAVGACRGDGQPTVARHPPRSSASTSGSRPSRASSLRPSAGRLRRAPPATMSKLSATAPPTSCGDTAPATATSSAPVGSPRCSLSRRRVEGGGGTARAPGAGRRHGAHRPKGTRRSAWSSTPPAGTSC